MVSIESLLNKLKDHVEKGLREGVDIMWVIKAEGLVRKIEKEVERREREIQRWLLTTAITSATSRRP